MFETAEKNWASFDFFVFYKRAAVSDISEHLVSNLLIRVKKVPTNKKLNKLTPNHHWIE